MKQAICITGMHRSGTSLTASWLQKCGLTIDNGLTHGSAPGNIKGHYEDKEFADFHASIIARSNKKSEGWKYYSKNDLYFSDHQLATAKQLVDDRNSKFDIWGWKDPRSVFFLEQWKQIIPNLKVFLIWRPAQEVALSLLKRSKETKKTQFSNFHINCIDAFKLWNLHNQKVCRYKKMYPNDTVLIPLHTILDKDHQVLEMILDSFQINLNHVSISQLYNSDLMNHRRSPYLNLIANLTSVKNTENNLKELSNLS